MANLKQRCIEILREEGYCPSIDDDGDVKVKVQGLTMYIRTSDNDEEFLKVWLPNIWSIENDNERAKLHWVANKLNREYKCGKVYLTDEDTHIVCEIFISDTDNKLKSIVVRCLMILAQMRGELAQIMRQE